MGYDRQTSSGGVIVAIAIVAVLLVVFLMVLGGGALFFVRSSQMEQRAVMEMNRARDAEVKARILHDTLEQQLVELAPPAQQAGSTSGSFDSNDSTTDKRVINVTVDKDGNLKLDDTPTDGDALLTRFKDASADGNISVIIRVDERCLFQHVASVLATCQQGGVDDYQLHTMEPTEEIDSSAPPSGL